MVGMEKKFFNNTNFYNGCGPSGVAIKFSLQSLEVARAFIKAFGGVIDSEKSREESYKHAQWLIEQGNYTYYHDEENGTPYDKLPAKERDKIYAPRWGDPGKWSKWTPELILQRDGWYDDEVYWFSIQKDDTYTYQLILKEGDWIFRELLTSDPVKFRKAEDVDGNPAIPYMSDWEEISEEEFKKQHIAYKHIG